MSDWYMGRLARQDQDIADAYAQQEAMQRRGFAFPQDAIEPPPSAPQAPGALADQTSYDPWERAAARVRFGAKPLGGRQEGAATSLPENLLFAAPRAAAGFTKAAFDRAAEEHGGVPQLSTDYDPRRMGAFLGAETATNLVGVGGAPAGAVGSGRSVRPSIGHNQPPPEAVMAPGEILTTYPSWLQGLPASKPAKRATEIPDIRELPVEQAVEIARKQPHLIKSGEQSEGVYVGGPREIQSKAALNKARKDFDAFVAADPRGGDWYDRYRRAMTEVTGGDPAQNRWMSAQHGQWSAGVDPGSELHFVLKEQNAALAGMPVKAARPAQHEAHMRALALNDPTLYQLGDKTGEYASLINATRPRDFPGATGVNDFRHFRNWGFTEPSGAPQKGAGTAAQHTFLDYETALAVDRANKMQLGGRSDWTGEQLQAAPWVRQKAQDLMSRNPELTYDEAFKRANRQIGDFFDKHTYFATHEAQPGADVSGHMMGSIAAQPEQRAAFAADPRSTWATAPGGRDAIYGGLAVPGTESGMRVRPTTEMQGMYQRPDGTLEANPGWTARPLGTFDTSGEAFKQATPADRAILNAGEAVRAYTDAQNAGAWHKLWAGGPAKESNTLFYPRGGKATMGELAAIQQTGTKYGLPDVVDTGQGITSTRFWPPPEGGKEFERALRKGEFAQHGEPQRMRLDSDIIEYVDQWKQGVGSQAATKKMLEYVNATPELRAAFNNNKYIPERALAKLERDEDWAKHWDAPREDIQNARRIMSSGPGWVDRLEDAIKKGVILPALGAAIFAAAAASQQEGRNREGS